MKKLLIILSFALVSCDTSQVGWYTVKIVYCDNRPPKIVRTGKTCCPPDNRDISTYKQAVPTWQRELNVCELQIVSFEQAKD